MATVYILYSESLDKYYIGSFKDLTLRLDQHKNKYFDTSFTSRTEDWYLYLALPNLEYEQARKVESHIKRMKSKIYIKNLLKYPEIREKLILKYDDAGSSR
jgi:putative endonuclease